MRHNLIKKIELIKIDAWSVIDVNITNLNVMLSSFTTPCSGEVNAFRLWVTIFKNLLDKIVVHI